MKTIQFPRWAEVLGASDFPQKDRESYKVTLRWYLGWCHRHSVGCNVESARDFIEWARQEKQANEWMVERWREPIRWFFVMAKAQTAPCAEYQGANVEMCEVGDQRAEGDGCGEVEGAKVEQSACVAKPVSSWKYESVNDTSAERIEGRTVDGDQKGGSKRGSKRGHSEDQQDQKGVIP